MAGRSRLVLSIWAHCICQAGAQRLTQQQACRSVHRRYFRCELGRTSSGTSDVREVDAQASDLASTPDISLSRFLAAVFRLIIGYEGVEAGWPK